MEPKAVHITLMLGADLLTRPNLQPSSCNRWGRLISPLDFTSAALTITATDTAMATAGIIVGTTTNTGTMAAGIIMADPRVGTRGLNTGPGTIIAIGLLPPTTDTGDPITATIIMGGDMEQMGLHQTGLVLPQDQHPFGCSVV